MTGARDTPEQLTVQQPYRESQAAGGLQLSARLTPQFTLSVGTRIQHNQLNSRASPHSRCNAP
jgi:hypothetical protein